MHPDSTRIITAARTWLGTPYCHQASLKGVGTDCLGLIRGIWRDCIGPEPEAAPAYAPHWAEAAADVETLAEATRRHLIELPLEDAEPGDVLLFRWSANYPAKHAGLLTAPARMIHAQDGVAVCEIPLSPWWRRRRAFAFRFPALPEAG